MNNMYTLNDYRTFGNFNIDKAYWRKEMSGKQRVNYLRISEWQNKKHNNKDNLNAIKGRK